MTPQDEYIPGYKPSHIQHHASRTAENSAQYLLPHLVALAQVRPELQLLDIGTGPGSISASLANYIPRGNVVATDVSEEVLQQAKEHASQVGCHNIRFQTADAYELPFADDRFDVIHVSQVLNHLQDPVKALKEMVRVCSPGGLVAVREADMRTWSSYPDLPPLRDFFELMSSLMPRNNTGLSLISYAHQAGVDRSDINFSTSTYCHSTRSQRQVFGGACKERVRAGEMRKRALEKGIRTSEELDAMVNAWEQWIETEDACNACINGEIILTIT
ncbi:S-adenosyl-L-methionine-dependent methyltransferase [Coprinopsis marcescibilis]|uniref:S-adenosyl-L-methionine-dependent methyltransferase n=1 Tax=Coprinopsis marcescibilis TaxID=230819 RepID=A0A5C3KK76_COPMA|nr:S-adenosyl-L-methionine-dependent methyltransferase [Coprinopsis marcescibilis]